MNQYIPRHDIMIKYLTQPLRSLMKIFGMISSVSYNLYTSAMIKSQGPDSFANFTFLRRAQILERNQKKSGIMWDNQN